MVGFLKELPKSVMHFIRRVVHINFQLTRNHLNCLLLALPILMWVVPPPRPRPQREPPDPKGRKKAHEKHKG